MPQLQPTARDIASAIERNELCLAYQPQIDLAWGHLYGVEVLARWPHPRLGPVPPSVFVPIAEETGMIDRLTEWIIDAAFRQVVQWREKRLSLKVALNVSPINLAHLDFPDLLWSLCNRNGIAPEQVTIEITEGASQRLVRLMDNLSRFRLKGMNISLDDFGTGFSSIARLHRLPFNEIKIDQCFVSDIHRSRDSFVVTKAIIDLAHALGMAALGEGVECEESLRTLKDLGCDRAQGHHIGRPMTAEQLMRWAEERGFLPSPGQ